MKTLAFFYNRTQLWYINTQFSLFLFLFGIKVALLLTFYIFVELVLKNNFVFLFFLYIS